MRSKERHSPRSFSRYDDYERDGRYRRSRSRSYDRRHSRSQSYERRPRRSDSPREWVPPPPPSRLHAPYISRAAVESRSASVSFRIVSFDLPKYSQVASQGVPLMLEENLVNLIMIELFLVTDCFLTDLSSLSSSRSYGRHRRSRSRDNDRWLLFFLFFSPLF